MLVGSGYSPGFLLDECTFATFHDLARLAMARKLQEAYHFSTLLISAAGSLFSKDGQATFADSFASTIANIKHSLGNDEESEVVYTKQPVKVKSQLATIFKKLTGFASDAIGTDLRFDKRYHDVLAEYEAIDAGKLSNVPVNRRL